MTISADSAFRVELDTQIQISAGWDMRLARWVSNVVCPPVVAAVCILLVAYSLGTLAAWEWACFYLTAVVLVPTLYVVWLLRHGHVTDFHLRVREQRIKPLILTLAAVLMAWLMLWLGQAPPLLVVTAGAGLALVGIIFLVTLRWKISGHAAAISGFATLCYLLIGHAASPVALAVPLVIWARLRLRRHTLLQTMAGTAVGALILWVAFHLWTIQP